MKILEETLRIVLGSLFLVAGSLKLLDPAAFLSSIESFHLLPHGIAFAVALTLPWLESIAGIALWIKRGYFGGVGALFLLGLVFIFALGISWMRGLDIVCGCFGAEEPNKTPYLWLILRNLLMLSGLLFLLIRLRVETRADPR